MQYQQYKMLTTLGGEKIHHFIFAITLSDLLPWNNYWCTYTLGTKWHRTA